MYSFAVLTLSDKGFIGERVDTSGAWIKDYMTENGFLLSEHTIIPDEAQQIKDNLIRLCDEKKVNIIVTTGGTGLSVRDVTPEATKAVIEREVQGIAEAMRAYSMTITKRAMLSRGVCGVRGRTLIVNLPGSKKAVSESLTYILDTLVHGLDILNANDSECGEK